MQLRLFDIQLALLDFVGIAQSVEECLVAASPFQPMDF